MRKSSGSIMIILIISIVAFSLGSIGGVFHIGEEQSQVIIPTSLVGSADEMNPITNTTFQINDITLKTTTQTTDITPSNVKTNNSYTKYSSTYNKTNSSNYYKNSSNNSYKNNKQNNKQNNAIELSHIDDSSNST